MNANENPFATDRIEELLAFRPEWCGLSWELLEESWRRCQWRGAIIGPHGVGKTTLVQAWRSRCEAEGLEVISLFLNQQSRTLRPEQWQLLEGSAGKVVILDGEEQLSLWSRWRFYRTVKTRLLVTRHSRGWLPTVYRLAPSMEVLRKCIQYAAPGYTSLLESHLPQWWHEEQGNKRSILLRCYDRLADE